MAELADFLASKTGDELVHAVIVVLLAAAAYLSYRTHTNTRNKR